MTEAAPVTPAPAPESAAGKTLGIVGLILAFVAAPIGLILSIVAKVQSKGAKNTPATVGIVLSIIFIVGWILLWVFVFAGLLSGCASLGPGEHVLDSGVTLTCG